MTFSGNADADPDPTTQIAWPARNSKRSRMQASNEDVTQAESSSHGSSSPMKNGASGKDDGALRRMTTWDLINLSISMAGSQVAWTVELG